MRWPWRRWKKSSGRLAPVLTDKELQEINGLFTAYTFRRSKTRELWTTCCGKHKVIREERATAAEEAALYTRHTPVPKYRWGECTNTIDIKQRVACRGAARKPFPRSCNIPGSGKTCGNTAGRWCSVSGGALCGPVPMIALRTTGGS